MRALEEILVEQLMGLALLTFEDQLTDLLQMGLRLGTVVVMRGARPERLLTEKMTVQGTTYPVHNWAYQFDMLCK